MRTFRCLVARALLGAGLLQAETARAGLSYSEAGTR
jgi:hypothetical protein